MSSGEKHCFNSNCKEACDEWRRGWRRRTGDYANLCDRCSSAYEDGKFCETFHANASGWRCCESCGKQIHCGCIVSFHMFVLLDAGGIECLTCARKSYILTPNPAWPPPSHFLHSQSDKMKEFSVKSWSAIAGSSPVPLHHTPSLLKHSDFQSEVQTKRTHGRINILGGIEWITTSQGISSPERKEGSSYERLVNGKLKIGSLQTLGNSGLDVKEHSYSFDNSSKPVVPSNDSFSPNVGLATGSLQTKKDDLRFSAILPQTPAILGPSRKQCFQVGMKSSGECQMSNGKSQADCCGRNQLLPRYRPQITDEELQQISSNTKAVITPLFEKMLSASDAGRIGRLVLPKKCAEAYFPRIASPDGLPLKVLDVNGKEWVFQFRYWPNNNSRMYVLEGITPCIQSLKLQAGDVVTFSWLEQEGKFVIGGRKSSAIQSAEQGDEFTIIRNDASAQGDGSSRNKFRAAIPVDGHVKGKLLKDKPMPNTKRKNNNLSAKSKRLRINSVDMIELKLTWKEAQRLMRPTAKTDTSTFVVEGCEFEEFEDDAPVIGRPTILGDDFGKEIQWVQCEECFKWRKVPADALLLSRWICSENVWDVGRSLCTAAEELSKEQLEHMLPTIVEDYAIKKETSERDSDPFVDLEGLDALANLAFLGEGDATPASSETKHPRHKFGCPCVVCLKPPSRKGYKHKQSCECTSCISMKHRFRTLMERSEKKQYESGAEPSSPNSLCHQLPGKMQVVEEGNSTLNQEEFSKWDHINEVMGRKSSTSPLKGQIIDLNSQPEREEDISPGLDSVPLKSTVEGSGERPLLSQRSLNHTSNIIRSLVTKQMQPEPDGIGGSNLISCMAVDGVHHKSV